MTYMGQVKYLSNESQKQSRCVRKAIFKLKVLDDSLLSWMMKMHIFEKIYFFVCDNLGL